MCNRVLVVVALSVSLVSPASAQQLNDPLSALSINGTGRVDSAGATIPSASMVSPTPPGSAPLYHHETAPGAAVEIRVDGPPALPFALFAGAPAAVPIAIGPDLLEIDLSTIQLLVDGTNPTSLLDYSAFTGFDGVGRLLNQVGLPPGFGPLTLQAVILDPSHPPFGYRFTASVTLDTENGPDALMRNVTDALNDVLGNPQYLASLCSLGFEHEGASTAQFIVQLAAAEAGLLPDEAFDHIEYEGIGPDRTNMPPLPAGLPSPGANVPVYYQIITHYDPPPTCGTAFTSAERERLQRVRLVEQGGVWKLHGNQEDALVDAELTFRAGNSNPSGVDVNLGFVVEEFYGQHGGIASVDVSGPQLAGVDGLGRSTTAAAGTQPMFLDDGGGDGPSEWSLDVLLAANAAGTSRLPLVENASGPRDSYSFVIHWNDATTSGPYTVDLRAALDVNANPSAVLAAMPGAGGVTANLVNGGTAAAVVGLTYAAGNLSASSFGHFELGLSQPGLDYEYADLFTPFTPSTTPTVTLCTPFLVPGSTGYGTQVSDLFRTKYLRVGSVLL